LIKSFAYADVALNDTNGVDEMAYVNGRPAELKDFEAAVVALLIVNCTEFTNVKNVFTLPDCTFAGSNDKIEGMRKRTTFVLHATYSPTVTVEEIPPDNWNLNVFSPHTAENPYPLTVTSVPPSTEPFVDPNVIEDITAPALMNAND
jgi:hypothetical protein